MAFGTDGYIGISRQESYGVPTSNYYWTPFVTEGITDAINVLMEDTIRDRYDEPPLIEGLTTVEGDIAYELNPLNGGVVLNAAINTSSTTDILSGYVYQHKFTPVQTRFDANLAMNPICLHVYRGVDEAFEYMDGQITSVEINIAAEDKAKMNTSMICRTSSLTTAMTASYHEAIAYVWHQASISLGAVGISDYEDITVSVNNNLTGIALIDGTKTYSRIHRDGFREIRVSGTIDLPNLDEYDVFRAQTERQLIITLTGGEISSGYYESFKIDIPQFRYESFPVNIGGPGRISVGFAGRAVYKTSSAYAIEFTIVNSLASY